MTWCYLVVWLSYFKVANEKTDLLTENKGVFPDTKEQLLSGIREGGLQSSYGLICQTFLGCVVGSVNWRRNSTTKCICDFATISDKVFCIFMLDNSYDQWLDG